MMIIIVIVMMRIVNNNDAPKESMEFSVCEASLIMMRPKEALFEKRLHKSKVKEMVS